MDSKFKDKINNIDERVRVIDNEITELTQIKINLMIVRRELGIERCGKTLEDCFTDEIKELLKQRITEEES